MPLYRLTEEQQKQLIQIISGANIKGADALIIVQLVRALQQSVPEPKKEEVKDAKGK